MLEGKEMAVPLRPLPASQVLVAGPGRADLQG